MGKVEKRIIAPDRADPALARDGVRCALTPLALHGDHANALGLLAHSEKGQRLSLHVRATQAQAQSPLVNLPPQSITTPWSSCLFPHRVSGDGHFALDGKLCIC